jgi:3-deoxy-D-manno-octulosonic-acid transferase
MYELYSVLLAMGLLLSLPYWLVQWLRHGKYRAGLGQRLGQVPPRLPDGTKCPVIWVHAVSVGEVLAVSGLMTALKNALPQFRVLVSTTTATGQELARSRFGDDSVLYFPLDFKFAIEPYLRRLRPQLVVIAETEFWPNFLRLVGAAGVHIAIVNARISDRSLPRYRRWRRILTRVLRPIDIFLAQTEEDRRRLLAIGASPDRVQVCGNLKFDFSMPDPPPIVAALRATFLQAQAKPVVVCGSTVEEEEQILLEAFNKLLEKFPRAVMILAPRHPQRFEEVARLLEKSAAPFWRRSTWNGEGICGGVLLVDTIGELASLYALADFAFVGGSLVSRGGHNILEPAQHGVPIVVGPYTGNFRDVVKTFQANHAIHVVEPAELSMAFVELASNKSERESLGRRASETVRAHTGATRRTLEALSQLLGAPSLPMAMGSAIDGKIDGKEGGLATPPR